LSAGAWSDLLNEARNHSLDPGRGTPSKPTTQYGSLPGILLEGGISYDSNVLTGGAGLRYFGASASEPERSRQDQVTVAWAISTNTGKILKTVYTSRDNPVAAGRCQPVPIRPLQAPGNRNRFHLQPNLRKWP
jgi:hypothetical protein